MHTSNSNGDVLNKSNSDGDELNTPASVKDTINTSRPFPPVILRSLELIRENDKKYPDILPKVRDAIYSNYLKHHGVEGGLRSYNYVVMMVVEYLGKKEEGK